MKLVIVESPAKAKTINKYLGSDYFVMASFGHICDLPAKNGSVHTDDDFKMDFEVQARGEKTLRDIIKQLAKSDALYLASDPDREGEAIAWHIVEELKRRKKLKADFPVYRVVFHEITKKAINEAMAHPATINMPLVDAYLARRALDYLVGFNISPLLWRKLPGAKSAGRVQSVALRLICDREDEICTFKSQEYWGINVDLQTVRAEDFTAKLTHLNGKKLEKFDLFNETVAQEATEKIKNAAFFVGTIERKQTKRNPAPPFTTSTLQQEASRKLGFGAKRTMQIAQQLYESGLITYMRTDAVALSDEAIKGARALIESEYGKDFLPEKPRIYVNKTKNAQEAHEAIRPTNLSRKPAQLTEATAEQKKLYDLIFKRTVACQMASALIDKVAVDIPDKAGHLQLRATGQTIAFAGFIKVYKEDIDEDNGEDEEGLLPVMNEKEDLKTLGVHPEQHFTEPPPRFSEASLVKKMEELGIGRPSTYASILSVLQERNYVRLVQKKFIPEDTGRIVNAFMKNYFMPYVQYDYTAGLEDKLDDITNSQISWKQVLSDFWKPFHQNVQAVDEVKMADVLEKVAKALEVYLFPTEQSRVCPECHQGTLSLRVGKFGAFVGCSNYPKCTYTKPIANMETTEGDTPVETEKEERLLGKNEQGVDLYLKKGPYGWYVQLGMGKDAKRTGLPKGTAPDQVDFKMAVSLLSLPKELGIDPETKESVSVGLGRFGPYVKRGTTFVSVVSPDNILTLSLDRALELLKAGKTKTTATQIGTYENKPITFQTGRYGPYVKWGKVMASVKTGGVPSLEEAIKLIQQRMRDK